jgi:catechol 2,3-dioxygenase-like lactoylglutathione lyase family enzyme
VTILGAPEAAMGTHTEGRTGDATGGARVDEVDMKLEVIAIPVSDVDRAKHFYQGLGWRLDADLRDGDGRLVQLTPPGSPCSIHFGTSVTSATPGSAQNLFLVVSDIQAVREELVEHGVEVSEVFHFAGFDRAHPDGRLRGAAPGGRSYGSFVSFGDPDGNGWLVQEVTTRLPGRIDPAPTTFGSARDLAGALRRAEAAHGEHEKRTGQRDANWPDWYAAYMVAEQAGEALPQ